MRGGYDVASFLSWLYSSLFRSLVCFPSGLSRPAPFCIFQNRIFLLLFCQLSRRHYLVMACMYKRRDRRVVEGIPSFPSNLDPPLLQLL